MWKSRAASPALQATDPSTGGGRSMLSELGLDTAEVAGRDEFICADGDCCVGTSCDSTSGDVVSMNDAGAASSVTPLLVRLLLMCCI